MSETQTIFEKHWLNQTLNCAPTVVRPLKMKMTEKISKLKRGKTRDTCGKNKYKTNRIVQFMFVIGLYVFQCLMKFTAVGESLAVVCHYAVS